MCVSDWKDCQTAYSSSISLAGHHTLCFSVVGVFAFQPIAGNAGSCCFIHVILDFIYIYISFYPGFQ